MIMRNNRPFLTLLIASYVLMAASIAHAAHPLITDDTGTQGSGKFQLEVNGEYGSDRETSLGVEITERSTKAAATLSYGAIDSLDVIVGVPYLWLKGRETDTTTADPVWSSEKGLSDVTFELKWRFYEKEGLSLAVKPGISSPTGSERKGLGAGKYGFETFFIATQELKPFTIHVNAGYLRNNNQQDEQKNIWHLSIAGEYEVVERLRFVANIGEERNSDATTERTPAFGIVGVIYSISGNLDLDAGVKVGLSDPETDRTVLAGIAWRF